MENFFNEKNLMLVNIASMHISKYARSKCKEE